MKNFIAVMIVAMGAATASLIAGESLGLVANLEGCTQKYFFKQGVSGQELETWNRSMQSAGMFIRESDSKLYTKFEDLQRASNVLFNTVHILYSKYIVKIERQSLEDPFYMVDKKTIAAMEQELHPLHSELKKIKGSLLSGVSLFKKSDAQIVFNKAKDILVKRMQEIIDEFAQFKKVSGKLSVNTSKTTVSEQSNDLMNAFENAGKKKKK